MAGKPAKDWPRHPDLDAAYQQHAALVFWAAAQLRRKFGGSRDDYLGICFLRLNRCLWTWREGAGANFVSYFLFHLGKYALQEWLRMESDAQALRFRQKRSESGIAGKEFMGGETWFEDVALERENDVSPALEAIVEQFGTVGEFWDWLLEPFGRRERQIIRARFRKDKTLKETGQPFGLTRERIRQIEVRVKKQLRLRLESLAPFAELAAQWAAPKST